MKTDTQRELPEIEVLQLNGRFDAHEASKVAARLAELTDVDGPRVIVNLGGVGFIDSAALSTLLQAMKRARQRQGDCRLCALQPPVSIIFELTRLDQAFEIFKDEYSAVQSFANAPLPESSKPSNAAVKLRWGNAHSPSLA